MIDLIVNPVSGKGEGQRILSVVEEYLKAHEEEYKVHLMTRKGEAKEIAAKVCAEGAEKIAAIGGDGTFHEVLNGMDFTSTRLGLIPAGRGNDFASGAGISSDSIRQIASVVQGKPLDLDYIQLESGLRCLNVCGAGLDVEVLKVTDASNKKLTYIKSLFKCLLSYKPYKVRIEVNGQSMERSCIMAALCNGTQFGGGIRVCPPASYNDGKMDLMIVSQPKIPTLMVMPGFVAGRHMSKNYVEHIVCDKASIELLDSDSIELDGEIYQQKKLAGTVVAGGFKTFAPAD